jgi:hypothetical protein
MVTVKILFLDDFSDKLTQSDCHNEFGSDFVVEDKIKNLGGNKLWVSG